jgi:hypothetical protein
VQCEKQPSQIASTELPIPNSDAFPKYRINWLPELFSIISPMTKNCDDNRQNESKSRFASPNAKPEIKTIPPGIVISLTAILAKANFSILCSRDPELNVINASDLQNEKHDSQITSTEAGR